MSATEIANIQGPDHCTEELQSFETGPIISIEDRTNSRDSAFDREACQIRHTLEDLPLLKPRFAGHVAVDDDVDAGEEGEARLEEVLVSGCEHWLAPEIGQDVDGEVGDVGTVLAHAEGVDEEEEVEAVLGLGE